MRTLRMFFYFRTWTLNKIIALALCVVFFSSCSLNVIYRKGNILLNETLGVPPTPTVPDVPDSIVALGGTANVVVSWDAASGADTYSVYRSTTAGSGYVILGVCSAIVSLNCTDLTALNGTTYYYIVRAKNTVGETANSSEVLARPIASFSMTGVSVNNAAGPNALQLSWTSAVGASDYDISWGTGGSPVGSGARSAVTSPLNISNLTAGTQYTFRVTAKNTVGSGTSVFSSPLSGIPMTRPVLNSVVQNGTGRLKVTWAEATGATAHSVKYGTSSGVYGSLFSASAVSPTVVTGLTDGLFYYLMVVATNASGSLNAAAEKSEVPLADSIPFVSVWKTTTINESITLPLRENFNYAFSVNWGDGSPRSIVTSDQDPDRIHTYAFAGNHIITISGLAEAWYFNYEGDRNKIIQVLNFGNLGWKNLQNAFSGCENLTSFSGGQTSQVVNMSGMFQGASGLVTLDVSTFQTSNVTDMSAMFAALSSQITSLDVSGFNTSNVTEMQVMFDGLAGLTTLDVSSFDTARVTNMSGMFRDLSGLTALDVAGFNTSKVTDMSQMFSGLYGLTSLDVSGFNTSSVMDMNFMFSNLSQVSSLNVSGFNTSKVTSMRYVFRGMTQLGFLDVSGFNTEKVISMEGMFNLVTQLPSLNVSGFDTSKVTSMNGMFAGMHNVTALDVSGFNTSNVTSMAGLFAATRKVSSLNLSGWNTSKVITMEMMFRDMQNMTSLDVSSFDTSKVTRMDYMFAEMTKLASLNLSAFNTAKVESMQYMFKGSSKISSLNLSTFNTSQVRYMRNMFEGTTLLTLLNVMGWNLHFVSPSTPDVFLSTNPALVVRCNQGGTPGTGTFFGKTCHP